VIDALSGGGHHFVEVTAAVAVFALVANLAVALYQRDRMLSFIERAIEAHRIATPGAPK
jgi:hypothetical protein